MNLTVSAKRPMALKGQAHSSRPNVKAQRACPLIARTHASMPHDKRPGFPDFEVYQGVANWIGAPQKMVEALLPEPSADKDVFADRRSARNANRNTFENMDVDLLKTQCFGSLDSFDMADFRSCLIDLEPHDTVDLQDFPVR